MNAIKVQQSIEFGDFQTPTALAAQIIALLHRSKICPATVVEPTCGRGNFLFATLDGMEGVERAIGLDLSPHYIDECKERLQGRSDAERVVLRCESFFEADWQGLLADLPEPLLIVGNPPWVTNAQVGALGGTNLPEKTNFQNHTGLDALTGKSNFDISEWMLLSALNWLRGREGVLAMLVKTTVARKLLAHAWKNNLSLRYSAMYHIDAARHFGAMVDACLFVCALSPGARSRDCVVYKCLDEDAAPVAKIGWRDGQMVADVARYERWKHLSGEGGYKWRSGVKHDCSKVMELERTDYGYKNGFGECVDIEDAYLFPMLKTSQVAKCHTFTTRVMLVTQRHVGEDTNVIRDVAPLTWAYLQQYAALLDARGSTIYKKRPRFSIFGIGDYSFAPWKVAISGFYKRLSFAVVGPQGGKPVVLDDASYFVPCHTQEEAEQVAALLNSPTAHEFFRAFIFWDAKRPITVDLLRRLDLTRLACELGIRIRNTVS